MSKIISEAIEDEFNFILDDDAKDVDEHELKDYDDELFVIEDEDFDDDMDDYEDLVDDMLFDEKFALIGKVNSEKHGDVLVIRECDVDIVKRYYKDQYDEKQIFDKICESHNLNPDNVYLLVESKIGRKISKKKLLETDEKVTKSKIKKFLKDMKDEERKKYSKFKVLKSK